MGHFATGVTVVAGFDGDVPLGFTAQSFTSVSLDPPLVSVCPSRSSTSWAAIREGGVFAASILSEDQEATARLFATRGADRFRGVGWHPAPGTGSPLLDGAVAWVDCRVVAEHDGGDHLLVLARVIDLAVAHEAGPLLFYRGGYGRFVP